MLQRRNVSTRGMHPLLGLLELLRVTQEYDAVGSLGASQNVRKGHLTGLVHEQDIH